MADISTYLEQILKAIYGEEVRGSIHDALAAMNEEAMEAVDVAIKSQNSALASANAAKESENQSALYETAAKISEENSAKSEMAAKLAEENAITAKVVSEESAQATKQSELKAEELANSARASELAAKEYADKSANSESNAKQSETNAAESAVQAKQEHEDYSQWVTEQEQAFTDWFNELKSRLDDNAVVALTDIIIRERTERILLNGFADGTKEISDDGTVITLTDSSGSTLVKTFTDDFQTLTVVLNDNKTGNITTLVKKFDTNGQSISTEITYS